MVGPGWICAYFISMQSLPATSNVQGNDAKRAAGFLRVMLLCLIAVYAMTTYLELHPHGLSAEAMQYRQLVIEIGSGLSLYYALQKVFWALGSVVGLSGAVLLFVRRRSGLLPLALAGPLMCVAALLGAAPSAYPDVEATATIVLWCVSSALWAGAVIYALALRGALFPQHNS